jgi:hypothetical protein
MRLSNYEKLAYLHEWPVMSGGMNAMLDSKLRNALSHNSVRHDLRAGLIVDDHGVIMSYFELAAAVFKLNTALHILMNILHSVRMAPTQKSIELRD